jgi:hypothetical protein
MDMTTKELALEAIRTLPEDATLEDVFERLYVVLKIEKGLAQSKDGRTVSNEEARERLSKWLK